MRSADEYRAIERRLEVLMASVPDLPVDEIASARGLIDAGEYEIALENLITQIVELDVEVDAATQEEFRQFAWTLDLKPRYFELVEMMILQPFVM